MSQRSKGKKIFSIGVLLAILFTLFSNLGRYSPWLKSAQSAGFDFFSTIQYSVFHHPVTSVTNFMHDLTSLWQVRNENDLLRSQLAFLEQYQAANEFNKKKIAELEDILAYKQVHRQLDLVLAEIVLRSADLWNDIITINAGTKQGIAVDQAVIIPSGLIGRVASVSENQATVSLLLTKQSLNKVSIKLIAENNRVIHGILEHYDYQKKAFLVNLLEANVGVAVGSSVVTSGLGGIFPENLLLGKVNEIIISPNDLVTKLYVNPAANFSDFNLVFVVKTND